MKRTLILPVLLALAACSGGPADPQGSAKTAFAAQDYAAARLHLIEALRAAPGDRALLQLLAETQLRMGDPVGAIAALDKLGAGTPALTLLRAEALVQSGKAEAALALLGSDETPGAQRIRGAAQLGMDDPAAAGAAYRKGMAAGHDLRLAADYAAYLLDNEDVDGAGAVHSELASRDPQAFETLMLAARLATARDDQAGALTTYRAVAKRFPARIEPVCAEATLLEASGKGAAALELIEEADRTRPGYRCVTDQKTVLLAGLGRWEEVRAALQRGEGERDFSSPESLTYAEALLRLGQPEQARALFTQALQSMPQNPYSRLMLAEAQLNTGDGAQAYATLGPLVNTIMAGPVELELAERAARAAGSPDAEKLKARRSSPEFAAVQQLIGQGNAAVARRDWSAALAVWQDLARRSPDGQVMKRVAFALRNAGRGAEAVAAADRAMLLLPEDPDAIYLAGQARIVAGQDRARAIELLTAASAMQPGNRRMSRDLAQAKAAAG